MEGKSYQSVTVSAMSCFLVGLGEEGASENSFPPSPSPPSQVLCTTGGGETARSAHFVGEEGREEGAGVSPGQHRRARNGSAVALPQGTIDSYLPSGKGEIREGREAFSAQVALAILKGIDPNIHSSSSPPSAAHVQYVPSSGWYMDWSEVDSRADLQCQCSFSRQNQNEVDGR